MANSDPLKSIPLFHHFTKSDREELARHTTEMPYKKGEFVFREGDPASWFHIVKEGTVKCVKSSPDGREVTLKVLLPGELFCCDAAVMDNSVHPGCAQVIDQAKILRVSKKPYMAMLKRNPEAAIEVITYLGRRLREAQESAKSFALDRAEQRLASLFVDLAERASVQDTDGLRLTVPLTRQDLADMAGLTVETTIRIMSRFKQAQMIWGTAKRLVVRDLSKLKALATLSDPPDYLHSSSPQLSES
ncbi:MAG: helix-turn-helix domain-containing protein [Nitrospirales bacterium]|nr:helix-turn-helix domain-containing protein [Nitrospirales bacterium]